jgi:hypothetical protein
MSHDRSPRLSLPLLAAGQAQKEITHNEALQAIDALVQPVVVSAGVAVPPSSPAVGACWIVAVGGSGIEQGEWAGHQGEIAQWTAGGWRFAIPSAGWRCHVIDRSAAMSHDGVAWHDDVVRADGVYINGDRIVGARSAAITGPTGGSVTDNEARAAINLILAMLRDHGLIAH